MAQEGERAKQLRELRERKYARGQAALKAARVTTPAFYVDVTGDAKIAPAKSKARRAKKKRKAKR